MFAHHVNKIISFYLPQKSISRVCPCCGWQRIIKREVSMFNAQRPWPGVRPRSSCRASAVRVPGSRGRAQARPVGPEPGVFLGRLQLTGGPCFIKLEPDNRKPIISEGTLSPEHRLNSGSCCCPRDDMERSTAGRPEAALGVSPFPPNLAESCSLKNAVFLRWGTRPSARALSGLLRNHALPQSSLFFH